MAEEDDLSARVAELEKKMARLQRDVFSFQVTVARKLTEALTFIQKTQEARDAKVSDALRKVVEELTEIRNRLGAQPRITH
jgi:phage-related protein